LAVLATVVTATYTISQQASARRVEVGRLARGGRFLLDCRQLARWRERSAPALKARSIRKITMSCAPAATSRATPPSALGVE
jgi:hypothetical protein